MPDPGRLCRACGHWQSGVELGMDSRTGYCNVWKKLTSAAYTCDRFVDKTSYQREQERRYEEIDDEGGDE